MAADDGFPSLEPASNSPPRLSTTSSASTAATGSFSRPSSAQTSSFSARNGIQITIPTTEDKSSMGGLKSYTAYCIQVNDFGRTYVVERRFDDFCQLHANLVGLDPGLPPLPEKKMFASTDASTVAERRPAFEKLLQHMLRSEDIAFESNAYFWKFIEMPDPGMVVARYLYPSRRIRLLRKGKGGEPAQMAKIVLDPKYEKDHAYRVCHESVMKVNLHLLSDDTALMSKASQSSSGSLAASKDAAEPAADGESQDAGADKKLDAPQSAVKTGGIDVEAEFCVLEMLRYAVAQGGESLRKAFLEADGVKIVLELLQRMARRDGGSSQPEQRVRNVLNALVQSEGERFPAVFADFLGRGGVSVLSGFRDLCERHAAFAEFLGKLLWLAWEPETQRTFLEADTTGSEGLALLSALFASGTKSGQIMAGLLLSSLIANGAFAADADREKKAAMGVDNLVEELLVSLPVQSALSAAGSGSPAGGSGGDQKPVSKDVQAAESFLMSAGKNERSFARLMRCIRAPCDDYGNVVADQAAPSWSACSFCVWCLLKIQTDPERVAAVRQILPALAQVGPPRLRWLAGEFLLTLHKLGGQSNLPADVVGQEQLVMEATMSEQLSTMVGSLHTSLQDSRNVMAQQQQLVVVREEPLVILGDGGWSQDLDCALRKLGSVRDRLSAGTASLQDMEQQSSSSLDTLQQTLQLESNASEGDIRGALAKAQEAESRLAAKNEEWQQLAAVCDEQGQIVEQYQQEMEEAERKVAATRKTISDIEQELSGKQREAQTARLLASSDRAGLQTRLQHELSEIETKMLKFREQAATLQASTPDPTELQEKMNQLKQEAQKPKVRRQEIQDELKKLTADPAEMEESAVRAERAAVELQEQLTALRSSELVELERAHYGSREMWQQQTTRLQDLRWKRDGAERERSQLKSQLDGCWQLFQPLWSSRLKSWQEKSSALSEAQVRGRRFGAIVENNWTIFNEEQEARQAVLAAIGEAQRSLQRLAEQVVAVGDI
eukprot:TRINITY_DN39707_c0_g1_i1.p1 TRINITY_DN39707_c0_g1~~TRINITY_DN39707_c0_g1_i1.p1  ORF type:complete len:1008 (-),score=271.90 TRINITY_DN39707_c0_g1_i1:123-3146(-)